MFNENIVLFSGYAKLPSGTASSEMYKIMGLVVLVDTTTGTITDADCTLSTRLSERFVASMLVGRSLQHDVEGLLEQININYQGSAKKAIITAINIIREKYLNYMKSRGPVSFA